MQKIVVIVGTNASGKSGLAISLAEKFNGEVVSADSRQVYKGLDIATGKVTKKEMRGIPHHLIDRAEPTERYSAADFAEQGQVLLKDMAERGVLPIIAGGTGFYIDALLNPSLLAGAPPNEILRTTLEKKSAEDLFTQLEVLDPRRANDIKAKNETQHVRRLIRAIEIALQENNSDSNKSKDSAYTPYSVLWIGIRWEKEVLNTRIHERTIQRLKSGMIEEARTLHSQGLSYERLEELGLEYKHLADYLREYITHDELIEKIETGDRQYAKQQRTWFKRNKEINWFEGGSLEGVEGLVEEFLKT